MSLFYYKSKNLIRSSNKAALFYAMPKNPSIYNLAWEECIDFLIHDKTNHFFDANYKFYNLRAASAKHTLRQQLWSTLCLYY